MIRFQLFRLRLFLEPTFFNQDVDRVNVLREIVFEKPSAELKKGYWWHVGNVKGLGKNGAFFALGRTTKSMVELYDPETKDFIIDEHPESPYTHVYVDFPLQVLAIGYKNRLAPKTESIAKQLEKLLNQQERLQHINMTSDIAPLIDPRDFLTHLKEAAVVRTFTADFTLPNPFDSEEDFEKPFQRFINASEGNKGKASVSGSDLNRDVIENIARSCAASGNGASARMKDTETSRFRTRHLKGRAVTLDYNEEDPDESPESFFEAIKETYKNIRTEESE